MTTDKDDGRLSAADMDAKRQESMAYEYLCHLEEAKVWIEACIKETLPATTELEEGLRNGVALAKLAHYINSELVPLKRIFDRDESRYQARGLQFRHTDNINHWLKALDDVGLPKTFWPETTDIYDRKNMPRVIYCIHALSLYLFKLGKAPQIQDLYGKINFTEEELSAMRRELDKYGIQMPAFSKIGGILANEMPVDEAALHAAIIAINDAIEQQVPMETVCALQNPAAHLVNIMTDLGLSYQETLFDAKETKAEIARNKSLDPDSSYIPDVYDELLTQAELQGNINRVNTLYALGQLQEALDLRDENGVLNALRKPQLGLRNISDQNVAFYIGKLLQASDLKMNSDLEDKQLTKDEVQMAVNAANVHSDSSRRKSQALLAINKALEHEDSSNTLQQLQNPAAHLPLVDNHAAALYHAELSGMREEKNDDLDHEELETAVNVLNSLARINQTVDTGSSDLVLDALQSSEACLRNIDPAYADKYLSALKTVKTNKTRAGCEFLNHLDVQKSINQINQQVVDENDRISAVKRINEAVASGDPEATLEALRSAAAALTDIEESQAPHYQTLLARIQLEKAKEMEDPSAELWYEEIQNTIDLANSLATEANELSVAVAAINIAVDSQDSRNLLSCLQNKALNLHSVTSSCDKAYLKKLADFKQRKALAGETGSGWMMNRIRDGMRAFFNVHTMQLAWERPDSVRKDHSLLTREELQSCITEVTSAHDRLRLYRDHEKYIIQLQARVRGCLARQRIAVRLSYFRKQLPAVLKIQAWWRMMKVRNEYQKRMEYLLQMEDRIIRLQSAARTFVTRKKHLDRLSYFKRNEDAVIKIQAFMRSVWAKQDYRALMHAEKPPLSVVRRFVHLLDVGDLDYNEEIEVEKLRQQVVTEIRSNQRLEADLNQMDIKIGLLVKNRITLQDVICHHRTLKKYRESSGNLNSGLKALSKSSRERLEAYQHLFYLLQTNPVYLARLIFEMPQSRTTKFMESVILTLYNYASNPREEYLLLNLFKKALQEEIFSKVDMMSDIVTGNPLVVKMIVSFNRNSRGQGSLREFLHPLVTSVVNDKNLLINTNPVEVYKQWVNNMESESGKASGLPYEVTMEQALRHEEVQDRIRKSVEQLQQVTDTFLVAILNSINSIPYGMRYMAKVLRDALFAKFPGVPEKDVLKIVGNLIYYRYINSAIVAPDAFDIMEVGPSRALTNDQRRNLGSVAKILQFAASNKGFGGESSHLSCLNKYIMDAHSRFKKYFAAVCCVEEPEVHFNIDQYTDVTRLTKPVIYISIGELIDTHKLLLEHQACIAPDRNDLLHELLDDLGDTPSAETLMGESSSSEDNLAVRAQLSKTEVSLTLTNKYEVPDEDGQSDVKALLLSTKRLVVELIRCQQSGENLREVLVIPATSEEEGYHSTLIQRRDRVDQRANRKAKLVRQISQVGDMRQPLNVMKSKVSAQLEQLERSGVITRTDNYQNLINGIVQDMRKQRYYRQRRRQEMVRLRGTVKSLSCKRKFQEEQIDFYNKYVRTCLDNLDSKRKSAKRGSSLLRNAKSKGTIKYSAARLHEKGVILEIEDLPTNQFKNVLFEISATESAGEFNVNAKFMGVNMEQVKLVFQDLLQLQYEGVAVMKMFDKARVNVNLLIFLINKKFYGK